MNFRSPLLSRTRGFFTGSGPTPVTTSRSGRWPLRTTCRRPSASTTSANCSIAGPVSRQGRIALHDPTALARRRSPLCATLSGFSLHARTTVDEGDKPGRERLIKYILRPPLAADRLERLEGGRVRLRLKRAFGDGTFAVEMDELSLVARLAAVVPPPWQNQVRYSGVLAPAAKWRSRIVATAPGSDNGTTPAVWQGLGHPPPEFDIAEQTTPKGKGCRYWPWRYLKARTFGQQTTKCTDCQGDLVLRALVQDAHSIHRILTHLGLPTDVPRPAHARGPPYYRGRVRRLRPGGDQQQCDL